MYINMLEHMNRNEILIILGGWVEGGGGQALMFSIIFLILLNYVFISTSVTL